MAAGTEIYTVYTYTTLRSLVEAQWELQPITYFMTEAAEEEGGELDFLSLCVCVSLSQLSKKSCEK